MNKPKTSVTIPAAITRRVHDDIARDFENNLDLLAAGQAVNPEEVISSARLLKCVHQLLPYHNVLIEALQNRQDNNTGLIRNVPEYVCWPKGLADITSYLRLLGATLKYPPKDLLAFADKKVFKDWLVSRNWNHPWGGPTGAGHMVTGAMFAMSDIGILTPSLMDMAFDYLDSLRDNEYGVWTAGRFEKPTWVQLGGAYYFGILYDRFRRPLPNGRGVCRMLMEMQKQTGTGTYNTNPTLDWPYGSTDHDALYTMIRYARLDAELQHMIMPSVEWFTRFFIKQMSNKKTYMNAYPIPKILALLRTVFSDSEDDIPYWDYEMYGWVF